MADRREFIGTYECMGGTTYAADYRWAILGEAEEVVRCRDCTHFSEGMGTNVWLCERMEYLDLEGWTKNVRVDPNGYCAWGERRDA